MADNAAFDLSSGPVALAGDVSTLLGTAALGVCLWQTRLARWTGMVVAVVSLLLIPLGLNSHRSSTRSCGCRWASP